MLKDKTDKYKAQNKYHERIGLKPYTFKLKQTVVDAYKAKCDERKQSYAGILTKLMKRYIESPEEFEEKNEPPTAQ